MEKKDKNKTPRSFMISFYVIIAIAVTLVVVLSSVSNRRYSVKYLSEYTYEKEESAEVLSRMSPADEASAWIKGFLNQYTGTFIPKNKRISDIEIEKVEEESGNNGEVNVVFNARISDLGTDYFTEWNPSYSGDRIYCDWTVRIGIKDKNEKNKNLYLVDINRNSYTKVNFDNNQNYNKNVTNTAFIKYKIDSEKLYVSFDDGATFNEVPVDVNKLILNETDNTVIKEGAYCVTNDVVGFICREKDTATGLERISVLSTTDSGANWKMDEVGLLKTPSYYYVNAFSKDEVVAAVECAGEDNSTECRIYEKTSDAGAFGQTGVDKRNRTVKEVSFIDMNTGFIAYEYDPLYDTNLYKTTDAGINFEEVIIPAGEVDSTATDKEWNEIYREAKAPKMNEKNELVLFVTQGDDGTYHGGKMAAKYISKDSGQTWEFIEETENYS